MSAIQLLPAFGHLATVPGGSLVSTGAFPFAEIRFLTNGNLRLTTQPSGFNIVTDGYPAWAGYRTAQPALPQNQYEVLAHLNSSSNISFSGSSAFDSWLSLNAERVWAATIATSGSGSASVTITIRNAVTTATVSAGTYTFSFSP